MPLADLLSQLDARPGVRGRQFERICAWYLRSAPEYRERIRKVWLWLEWSGAWAADAGIDLVAEERDGRLWAIQAKAYDPAYAIRKADVDSFLSESSRPEFSYRLLIATTDRLGPTARRTLDAQREPVGYLLRSQLELAHVSWPSSPDDLRPRRPARKKPLAHVREAVRATVRGFADHERGQLIMACGTGKTLAAMWIAERLESRRTLVLVPSLSLLAQTLREWAANASEPFEYLAVCSDQTVVGEDEFVQYTAELGFPVTTDPGVIAAFLRRRGRRVVFATYQSSPRIATACRGTTPQFDLAIADEAHRCAGRTSSEFATILDAGKIRSRRRLFMTATPRFYTPRLRREAGLLDVEVASMDDESVFGPVLHRLTFGEAIERDLLSDYQVVVVGVDNETYRAWAERGEFVTPDGEKIFDARTLAGEIAVAKAMRKYNLRRVISFHSRVNAARRFSEDLPFVSAWMPARARPRRAIWSEHVSGAMSSGHRDRVLLRFRHFAPDEIGLLSNARCLGEGVDVPSLDGVAFIDPRRSTIDIVQALGRAIRKSPDKTLGTIILPVFLSDEEDPDQVLDQSAFKHVWDVLKALRAHDEKLGEELDELRRCLGARRAAPRRPGKIKLDLPRKVGPEFARAFDVRVVEQTTAAWEFSYGRLLSFVEREGHSRVLSEYRDDDGYRLGRWVAHERQLEKIGQLSDDRARRLTELPEWTWSTQDADWEYGYARLRRFVEREAHALVPKHYRDDDGYQLGYWVGNQRQFESRGQLSKERFERLQAVSGWEWASRRVRKPDWEDGYARLKRFAQTEGHCSVPSAYRDSDGYRLGRWVSHQKQLARSGNLPKDHEQLFRRLPGWGVSANEAAWDHAFAKLVRFADDSGHARVPTGYRDDDGFRLGAWAAKQRGNRAKGRLSRERAARLEGLSGWRWDVRQVRSTDWDDSYARLASFVGREGHACVPSAYCDRDGYGLGRWVIAQRSARNNGRLSEDRSARLEALPGWVWVATSSPARENRNEAAWKAAHARLVRYVEETGDARVPNDLDLSGFKLGSWVSRQRGLRRKGQLSEERARRLESLAGWVWNPDDADWDDGYAHLLRFVQHERDSRVPWTYRDDNGYRLGDWVHTQRQARNRGELSESRARRLEELPGWMWALREANWDHGYNRLVRFAKREGHARPRALYRDADGYKLGTWVVHQRQTAKIGKLNPVRARRLAALPGWTWGSRPPARAR